MIDPERGFGQPVVRGRAVPVRVLAELVRAGDSVESVADWYELNPDQVRAAVKYEKLSA